MSCQILSYRIMAGQITAEEWMLFLQAARPNTRSTLGRKNSLSPSRIGKASVFVSNPDPAQLDERVRSPCLPHFQR